MKMKLFVIMGALCALACVAFESTAPMYVLGLGAVLQSASAALTDRLRPYDLLRWEPDQRYTRTAGTIKNASGVAINAGAIVVGMPVKLVSTQWTVVNATDEANTGGLFLGDDSQNIPEALANNAITAAKYPILVRGPALINKSVLPSTDLAGVAYTVATIVTALADGTKFAPPIQTLVEPSATASQQVQTT